MRLDRRACRERMVAARVARLATTGRDGWPHLVPVTFAVRPAAEAAEADELVMGIDQKPKTTLALRRLRNIMDNPRVAVLCDHYADDWSRLWWVRADGRAAIVADGPARDVALTALVAKYRQYHSDVPRGPVIVVTVVSWSGWSFSG